MTSLAHALFGCDAALHPRRTKKLSAFEVRRRQQAQVLAALREAGDEGLSVQKLSELLGLPFWPVLTIVSEVETMELHVNVRFDGSESAWATLSEEAPG